MHVYVHIPYCHRICPYCSFYKHKPGKVAMRALVEAVLAEARHYYAEGKLPAGEAIRSLYLGGGTPSLLPVHLLETLVNGLNEIFDLSQAEEICLEANPRTFDAKKAQGFRELGFTRVSLGIQSFDNEVLPRLGRDHSAEEGAEAFALLKEAEIPIVGIDLMFAVPGQSLAGWIETLERAIALRPEHISCYNLTYEEDTEFFERFQSGELVDDAERNEAMFLAADKLLTEAGFGHYETSNYAQPSCESLHNRGYWEGRNYLGLGPSAVSTINRERWKNVADSAAYARSLLGGEGVTDEVFIIEREHLDDEAWRLERLGLELRTQRGVELKHIGDLTRMKCLIEEGLGEIYEGRFRLLGRGRPLVDEATGWLV